MKAPQRESRALFERNAQAMKERARGGPEKNSDAMKRNRKWRSNTKKKKKIYDGKRLPLSGKVFSILSIVQPTPWHSHINTNAVLGNTWTVFNEKCSDPIGVDIHYKYYTVYLVLRRHSHCWTFLRAHKPMRISTLCVCVRRICRKRCCWLSQHTKFGLSLWIHTSSAKYGRLLVRSSSVSFDTAEAIHNLLLLPRNKNNFIHENIWSTKICWNDVLCANFS